MSAARDMSVPFPKSDLPDLAPLINQAVLDAHLDQNTLHEACDAARHFGLRGLCTNLTRLPSARKRLGPPGATKLIAVIAFPFGAIPSNLKLAEAEWAAAEGAEELEVVPNFLALSESQAEPFAEELSTLCELGLPVRAILDMAHLPASNLPIAIEASIDAGVNGIQTGNGFGPAVTTADVRHVAALANGRCAISAVGGVKTLGQALELIEAGANILGTSLGLELLQAQRRGNT